ncbi:hypothetical protein FG379_001625 [Cryptosporidium bovis]|uniref:uncharacterized protein n=1 Tax=Cryptosporidium bovis TaxID=310047 RepID=UPI003519F662|nr:hypothetical protein FG379_001625 [Cryptosporidium bovis]
MNSIPLLKSIDYKDPSLNWNIDVSSELEKYLSAIELLDEDISCSQNTEVGSNNQQNNNQGNYHQLFNFVEAALIIQNSTSLYSKKIEHLHSLVYETFNLLSTGKSRQNDAVNSINSGDNTMNNDNTNKTSNSEKNILLMSMSDILSVPIELLQPGKNINMQYDQYNKGKYVDEDTLKYSSYSSYIGISNLGNNISLPQYRIDQNTNALFLDETDLSHFLFEFENVDENLCINDIFNHENDDYNDIEGEYENNSARNIDFCFSEVMNNNDAQNIELNDCFDHNSGDIHSENMDNDNNLMSRDDANNDYHSNYESNNGDENLEIASGKSAVKYDSNVFRKKIPKEDFWSHLDEHIKVGKEKPLKLSKTYKNPSKLYTISLENIINKNNLINFIDDRNMISYILGENNVDGAKYENNTVPYFNDLKLPKLNIEKLFISYDNQENNYLRSLENEFTTCANDWRKYHAKSYFNQLDKNSNSFDNKEYPVDTMEIEYNSYVDGIEVDDILVSDKADDTQQVENNEISISEQDLSIGISDYDYVNNSENNNNNSEQYMKIEDSNKLDEDISELHEKINIWSEHVEPLLQAQKDRPEFNIYEEGKKIINNIMEEDDIQGPINFDKLTKGQKKWQVCRSFLATLMLANNKEIEIIDNENIFSVKLADKEKDDTTEVTEIDGKVTKISYPKKKKTKSDGNLENNPIEVNKKKKRS